MQNKSLTEYINMKYEKYDVTISLRVKWVVLAMDSKLSRNELSSCFE